MGLKLCDCGKGQPHYKTGEMNWQVAEISQLKYDSSWDALMEVVEKIENTPVDGISFNCEINKSLCEIRWTVRPSGKKTPVSFITDDAFGRISKIQMVYKTVLNFINWYNNRLQSKQS